jgi:hypothetical protein
MPTALELSCEEWQPYLEAAARRGPPPPLSARERRVQESLMRRVKPAADLLKTRFGARRVIPLDHWPTRAGLPRIRTWI